MSKSSKLPNSFIENHSDLGEDQAADLIVKSEQKIRLLKQTQSQDEKLSVAKGIVKDLNSSYKSAISYENAKVDYLLTVIEEIQADDGDKINF